MGRVVGGIRAIGRVLGCRIQRRERGWRCVGIVGFMIVGFWIDVVGWVSVVVVSVLGFIGLLSY